MSRTPPVLGPFRVGDRVTVPWRRPIVGEIVEDRGPIGRGRRHIYLIRIPMDPYEPMEVELPGEDLEPAGSEEKVPEARQVVEFLKQGGLIDLLQANRPGTRSQPRAWLRTNSLGHVDHTFSAERGGLGGQPIPFDALHGLDHISLPKVGEVARYIEGFGLDRPQADEIIRAVGTSLCS